MQSDLYLYGRNDLPPLYETHAQESTIVCLQGENAQIGAPEFVARPLGVDETQWHGATKRVCGKKGEKLKIKRARSGRNEKDTLMREFYEFELFFQCSWFLIIYLSKKNDSPAVLMGCK